MRLKYTLAVAALALGTAAQAQTWTADTLNTGTGYSQDAFYNISTGAKTAVANNNWDIAFITGDAMSNSVMVNHAGTGVSAKLYVLNLDAATKFGTNLAADTVGKTGTALELRNSPEYWEEGAFIQNATGGMNFGWGDYDVNTHFITGNNIYCLVNATGAYQIWIEQYQASATPANRLWKFHVAKLDGTDVSNVEFHPAPDYNNKLNAYYSLTTRAFVNREPDMDNWHLLATRYLDVYPGAPAGTPLQSTTGIVTNTNVELAIANPILPNDANYTAYASEYSDTRNQIGGGYKFVNMAGNPPGWVLNDSLSYFVKITSGTDSADIWQIYFDYFPAATTGVEVKIGLQKRRVFEYVPPVPNSVSEVNAFISNALVVPNPAQGGTSNLLVDAKKDIKDAQITIADLSGRVVLKATKDIKAGFQQIRLDVSQYPAGIYMINLTGAGFSTTQKLVVR